MKYKCITGPYFYTTGLILLIINATIMLFTSGLLKLFLAGIIFLIIACNLAVIKNNYIIINDFSIYRKHGTRELTIKNKDIEEIIIAPDLFNGKATTSSELDEIIIRTNNDEIRFNSPKRQEILQILRNARPDIPIQKSNKNIEPKF